MTACAVVALCWNGSGMAQTTDPASNATDDIIVTARRSAESIQSVPVSIAALSNEALREASISTPEDLMRSVPGVYLVGSSTRTNTIYSIRGQTRATLGFGQPSVVSYFAEVPDPTLGSATAQFDMASVQVLKGPQGTLFGRNTTGGAILFSPARPSWSLEGYAQGSLGNYDMRALEGVINLPIADQAVALRVGGQMRRRDGYTRNLGIGGNPDDVHSDAIRASLLVEPGDTISNLLIVDYYKSSTNGPGGVLDEVLPGASLLDLAGIRGAMLAQLATLKAAGRRTTFSDVPSFERLKRIGITNRTELSLGGMTLTNIFGYRAVDLNVMFNVDGVDALTADGSGVFPAGLRVAYVNGGLRSDIEQYTNELQASGTLFNDRLKWLVGGFYLKSTPDGPTGSDIDALKVAGTAGTPFGYEYYRQTSKALFANIAFQIVADVTLNAGYRQTWDQARSCTGTDLAGLGNLVDADACYGGSAAIGKRAVLTSKSHAPTWTIGLDWQATDDLFFYVTSRRGYRTGGINPPKLGGTLIPYQSFAPEKVTDLEIGMRSEWNVGDVRGRLNISAFRADYSDVQIGLTGVRTAAGCIVGDPVRGEFPYSPDGNCDTSDDPASGGLLANLGKTRVSGVEFDFHVEPLTGLGLDVSGTFLDPKTRSLSANPVLSPYIVGTEVPFQYSPKTSISAGVRYETAIDPIAGKLVLNADYYYSGKVLLNNYLAPSYGLFNLRAGLNDIANKPIDLSVFVRNATNKRYVSAGGVSGATLGVTVNYLGEPRMVGVELRYRFGGYR
ncbi:TonB-dependent receptor [Sphingobium fontiphilum]|nr:TonB-dependent receptor [Sphingobium fontiphilum]